MMGGAGGGGCRYVKIISDISSGCASGFFVALHPVDLWPVMSGDLEAGCSHVCGKHPLNPRHLVSSKPPPKNARHCQLCSGFVTS